MREAMFYEPKADNKVRCYLCNHHCNIQEGKAGICGVRQNLGGKLHSLVYGKIVAEHIDPIEKKPLFNFLTGSRAYSIGTVGCNFRCRHCQNFDISQYPHEHRGEIIGQDHTPEQIFAAAKTAGCKRIAYTYTEPTIFYEFAYDTCIFARNAGMKNIFVGWLSYKIVCGMGSVPNAEPGLMVLCVESREKGPLIFNVFQFKPILVQKMLNIVCIRILLGRRRWLVCG
jgi:pyruvate formate lyase activating enzyme